MISDEEYPFYYRPFLPEYVAGLVEEQRLWGRAEDFYAFHKIELKLNQRVVKVLYPQKLVYLETGEKIPFNTLLIATGGSPAVFRCPGWDAEGLVHLKTLADARRIKAQLPGVSSAVVIGTGVLGLELVDTFIKSGLETHYLLNSDNIWPPVLDEGASILVEKRLKNIGVKVYRGAQIKSIIVESNRVKGVLLSSGEAISCQLVGVAIGLRPNIDMVRWSGIKVRGMIFVNRRMQTNIPEIYAAGDVALCYELPGEASRCLPRWYRAWKQGEIAGLNMVGVDCTYQEVPICSASIKIAGTYLLCLGNPNLSSQEGRILIGLDWDNGVYKKIVLRDNRIAGALLLGDIREGAKIARLMDQGTPLTPWEEGFIKEMFTLGNIKPEPRITICPICKMEIGPAGCIACRPS
jgi:NAD(P)H-nitrite reductase large subunit